MAQLTVSAKQSKGTIRRHLFGHFSEHLGRCIYDGLYVGENSKIRNVNGMRADAVEALFADDADYRAQAGAFIESFHKFQTLLRYIFTLHTIGFADKLRRFDLFDVEAYDEVLAQVNRDLTDGTIPPFEARIF